MRFEPIEHTADLSFRAYGASLEELFENAAFGMFSMVCEIDDAMPLPVRREVRLSATDLVRLLRLWLAELLFLHESQRILFCRFEVSFPEEGALEGIAEGMDASAVQPASMAPFKAVTYHGLGVHRTPEGYEATIILDT